jgi:DNA-binding response OmpR family regulator
MSDLRSLLNGRSVALVALPRDLMMDVTAVLDRSDIAWQASSAAARLDASDVGLIVTSAEAAGSLLRSRCPVMVLASVDAVGKLDAGLCDDFVVAPPLDGAELLVRAGNLLVRRPAAVHSVAAVPVVVAADDDPTTTAIVRAVVAQNGMTCHIGSDGKTGLELVRRHRPAVVILDVNMPYLDGFQVLSSIRQDPEIASTPAGASRSRMRWSSSSSIHGSAAVRTCGSPAEQRRTGFSIPTRDSARRSSTSSLAGSRSPRGPATLASTIR